MSIKILKENKIADIKGIHLFGSGGSNNYMRTALMLEEKGLDWQNHTVNLLTYEQFSPEYLNLNPQGSIPAMIHDGIAVYGSENILKYLEKIFPSPSLTPQGKEAEMWKWVEFATRTHIEGVVAYLYSKKGGRPMRKDMQEMYRKHDPEKCRFFLERGYHMTEKQVQETENINNAKMQLLDDALKSHDYILGNTVSVADIAWLPDPIFIETVGFNLSPYPNVKKWIKRMQARPSHNKRTKFPAWLLKLLMPVLRLLSKHKNYLQ